MQQDTAGQDTSPDLSELKWFGAFGAVAGFTLSLTMGVAILGAGLGVNLGDSSRAGGPDVVGLVLGERIYNTNCASCHGATGGGNVGPAIGGGVLIEKYPFLSRQVSVITNGRGAMPSFATTLTPDEIEAVAVFERDRLGR